MPDPVSPEMAPPNTAAEVLVALNPKTEAGRAALRELDDAQLTALRARFALPALAGALQRYRAATWLMVLLLVTLTLWSASWSWPAISGQAQPYRPLSALLIALAGLWLAVVGYLMRVKAVVQLNALLTPVKGHTSVNEVWQFAGEIPACSAYLMSGAWTRNRQLLRADKLALLHLAKAAGASPGSRWASLG